MQSMKDNKSVYFWNSNLVILLKDTRKMYIKSLLNKLFNLPSLHNNLVLLTTTKLL